jgi:transposase
MKLYGNARTCPNSRRLLIEGVSVQSWPVAAAAQAAGTSERTVYRWLRRWREEGIEGLSDRSSAPKRIPHRTPGDRVQAIAALRRMHMTAAEIAEVLAMALSTVSAVLRRIGLGKRSRLSPPDRYERKRAGELVHLDIKKLGRISSRGAGHRVSGNRSSQLKVGPKRLGATGWEFVHVAVDDATRLAYVEVLPDERGATAAGFVARAIVWFASFGISVERVLSDNGACLPLKDARTGTGRARHPSPLHPALPATHQGQGGALYLDPDTPMGLRRDLRQLGRAHRCALRLADPLQTSLDHTARSATSRPALVYTN